MPAVRSPPAAVRSKLRARRHHDHQRLRYDRTVRGIRDGEARYNVRCAIGSLVSKDEEADGKNDRRDADDCEDLIRA